MHANDPAPEIEKLMTEYLTLAKAGDELGLLFVDSVLFDLFCDMLDMDAENWRLKFGGIQCKMDIQEE